MQSKDTAPSGLSASLALEPFRERVVLPPRLARRLRLRAQERGRSAAAEASLLLACALVPDPGERRRLVRIDLGAPRGERERA